MPPQLPADSSGASICSEIGRARGVVVVVQNVLLGLSRRVGAIFGELFLGQRHRAGDRLAGHDAFGAAVADAVLHARDLARMPAVEEIAQDAAVAIKLAVKIGRAFPDAQRGQMRRLQRADLPLVHGVIGNAVDADFAVAPALRAGPFDAVVKVLRLARRPDVESARRAPGAARVDAHQNISVRNPFLRVDQFPVLVFIARVLQNLWARPWSTSPSSPCSPPGTTGLWRRGRNSE